jgi:hypothetical protein
MSAFDVELLQFVSAAKVRNPPFTSKCAWRSNLTATYLIIVTHGPKLPLTRPSGCCGAARRSGHWCMVQHFCRLKRRSSDKLAVRCRRNIRYYAAAASGFISGNLPFDNRYAG